MSNELAKRISEVPILFETGNKSTASLFKDAAPPEMLRSVTVEEVETVLKREPRLIDLWLRRCRDQRVAGGWGIEQEGNVYRVRSFSGGDSFVVRDRLRACAEFVVRYVFFIGEVLGWTR